MAFLQFSWIQGFKGLFSKNFISAFDVLSLSAISFFTQLSEEQITSLFPHQLGRLTTTKAEICNRFAHYQIENGIYDPLRQIMGLA